MTMGDKFEPIEIIDASLLEKVLLEQKISDPKGFMDSILFAYMLNENQGGPCADLIKFEEQLENQLKMRGMDKEAMFIHPYVVALGDSRVISGYVKPKEYSESRIMRAYQKLRDKYLKMRGKEKKPDRICLDDAWRSEMEDYVGDSVFFSSH